MASPRRPSGSALAIAALAALAGCGGSADGEPGAATGTPRDVERHRVAWDFVTMGPRQRTIRIAYGYGGCEHTPREAVVRRAESVRITVTVAEPVASTVACPAIARIARPSVSLGAPLGGRRLLGWSGRVQTPRSRHCAPRPQLPSVLGMAAPDARGALAAAGWRVRGPLTGTIAAQRPDPGTCLPQGRRVALVAR